MLSDHSGHTMSEIAEFTMLNPPTLTKLVDRMVSANLVLRRTDEADRRRVLVFASATGHRVLARLSNLVHNEQQTLVAALGPEEIALLKTQLMRVSELLSPSAQTEHSAPQRPANGQSH
jgi:DNA-binding MarR family transcriptional regulator